MLFRTASRRRFVVTRILCSTAAAWLAAGLAADGPPAAQQPAAPALKIVVIEGENAANIIDQKTAVAPIVEVRDSNDLPVVGATVTFMLTQGGGNAVLNNGLRQVTLTTNAAGRATVAVNPLARGAIQIQVNATYQGQTAAATISQTNFATAAQAAQAAQGGQGSAAAGGGGAGGGGGLSGLAIAGIAGGAVAGAAVVRQVTKKDPCTFSVSPSSFSPAGTASTQTVAVTVSPAECEGPEWTASSGASFISVSPSNGIGSGSVTLTVNANTGAARTGTVTIAGQTVTVNQGAVPCSFSASPTTFNAPSAASTQTVNVTVSPASCANPGWTASSSASFVTVSPTSGSGSGTVTLSISANTGGSRSGTVTVAGQTITVTQNTPCTFNISHADLQNGVIAGQPAAGRQLGISVTATPTGCSPNGWTTSSAASFLTVSPASGSGNGTATVTIAANTGAARSGNVTIAGRGARIDQVAGNVLPCNQSFNTSGGNTPVTHNVNVGRTTGSFTFGWDMFGVPDRMVVRYEGQTLFDTGCVSGSGSRSLSFRGNGTVVAVEVIPSCQGGGTQWVFSLSCAQ